MSTQVVTSLFSRHQRIILWLASAAIFFEAFDVSIVNLALPVMAEDLKASLASVQWIQTIYLLSFGGFLLAGGRLCDHHGSKHIFITGMSLFGLASLLASLTDSLVLLLVARAGQGIGAALAMPGGISLLSKHFQEGRQRHSAMGIFGSFAAVGFAGGLALGGVIASSLDWHWIFGINVPVITGVVIAGYFFIPREAAGPASFTGGWTACWLSLTLLLFCFGIHEMSRLGYWVLPCWAMSLLSGYFLWRYDQRKAQPFIPGNIYHSASSYKALGAFFLLGASFLSFVFICTLGLDLKMHFSVRQTGLLLFPYSIGSAFVSKFLLPILFRRLQVTGVARLSMTCLLLGTLFLMGGIFTHQLIFFLVALFLVNSLAIAIGYPAFTILALQGVAPANQGIAAGLQSSINSIGTGTGISLIGLCLQAFSAMTASIDSALLPACVMIAVFSALSLVLLRKQG